MRVTFDEIAVKGVRRWTDPDGKKRQITRKFWQTVSPFNKGQSGLPKTREQILVEIKAERDAWLKGDDRAAGDQSQRIVMLDSVSLG